MTTFLIGGLWHGGAVTFLVWGFLHGFALVVNRFWRSLGLKMSPFLAWLLTFLFLNTTWVFFRAETWVDAVKVLKAMWGWEGINLEAFEYFPDVGLLGFVIIASAVILLSARGRNSNYYLDNFQFNKTALALFALFFGIGFIRIGSATEFLYFAF
jgi:alginate O-acetyltransferase complex protein AlgI